MELAAMLFVVGSLAVWALLSFGVGKIAARKGRNFAGWFIFSLVISPFLAVFLVLLLGESTAKAVRDSAQAREVVKVRCPECGGTTKEEADFCPDCGLQFSS
ncbi:zinc ribbon domain-containing protein [Salinibacter sp.]|uniref:zinc ribbon domain-containing protein n=1 Tax=Salinibacter sp. TaxID=2065818 RepID=UPI0021E785AF|nr:zinc ribbon domain-containing protein [Salinibacter sp.]